MATYQENRQTARAGGFDKGGHKSDYGKMVGDQAAPKPPVRKCDPGGQKKSIVGQQPKGFRNEERIYPLP
jgi:hypothetical protein